MERVWKSPDGKILKEVICFGDVWPKPYDNSVCRISVEDIEGWSGLMGCDNIVIGDSDTELGYLLDICLVMMGRNEKAKITFFFKKPISFTLHLLEFEHKGYVYEWNAVEKYRLAQHHKAKGVEMYNKNYIAASKRFGKAIKLLCLIPVEVNNPPEEIDSIKLKQIEELKAALYNNLASCYLKHRDYEIVLDLCKKTLKVDEDNIKALYKSGVAYTEVHLYEEAREMFKRLLELEPNNKAAAEKLAFVNVKLQEVTSRVNNMIKRMFVN